MSKKKVALIAGVGIYLGALNLPKQGAEAWKYYEHVDDRTLRVVCTALYTTTFPVIFPLDRLFHAVSPKMYDKAVKRMRIENETLDFREKMNQYEAEQKYDTKESN